jgi:hypothetical protein
LQVSFSGPYAEEGRMTLILFENKERSMNSLNQHAIKYSFVTHPIPTTAIHGVAPLTPTPHIGDLIIAEVVSLGKHTTIEGRTGAMHHVFPGDVLIGAFGNRYATDQYEGYVPARAKETCDLLSVGGVCGEVASRHATMAPPTKLRILGAAANFEGQPLNLRDFSLAADSEASRAARRASACEQIVVVGSSMNSGKTTTVGTLARALNRAGKRVAAAKITGTAAGKDARFFASSGAHQVVDFVDAGYPSTYLLSLNELMSVYETLIAHLKAGNPDYIIIEIADGIFQRETHMLLEHLPFRAQIDHLFFSANDSLSAECGVRHVRSYGLPLRGVSGVMTQSPLAIQETERITGAPVMTIDQIIAGNALAQIEQAMKCQLARPVAAAA